MEDLEGAIVAVTKALAACDDPSIAAELVAERAALRAELREMREAGAGVVDLDAERAKRG